MGDGSSEVVASPRLGLHAHTHEVTHRAGRSKHNFHSMVSELTIYCMDQLKTREERVR